MNRAAELVAPFYAVEINRIANERERRGLPVIHMEVGQPSAGAPRGRHRGRRARTEGMPAGLLGERRPRGTDRGATTAGTHGLEIDPSRILLTMGASAALVLAMSVLFAAARGSPWPVRVIPRTGTCCMRSGSCRSNSIAAPPRDSSRRRPWSRRSNPRLPASS